MKRLTYLLQQKVRFVSTRLQKNNSLDPAIVEVTFTWSGRST